MRHIFFSLTLITTIFCSSCSKESESVDIPPNSSEGISLSLSLNTNSIDTRAFFDDSYTPESWEKELHKATVLAFSSKDWSVIARQDLSESELLTGNITMVSPFFVEGDYIAIIAIANLDVPEGLSSYLEVPDLIKNFYISECNGTFEEVAYRSTREEGFIMTANAGITLSSENNSCELKLIGTVAKVAIDLSVSDKFNDSYSGSVKVNSVTVSDTPMIVDDYTTEFTHTQESFVSDGHYQNLFYVINSSPTFTINATYDVDGNFTTTSDQVEINYTLVLYDDYGDPLILKDHSYYRISITICGLDGDILSSSSSLVVSDWKNNESFDVEI